jgi:beta-barrel assembly-enhancing protease
VALADFARQTGLQVAYISDVIGVQQTAGAAAGLTASVALGHLLEGTGLRYEFLNPRLVRILADAPNSAPTPPLEEVIITARVPKPPHIDPATADELRTMDQANEDLETRIERAQLLYGDAALDRYVQRVAEHLLSTDATDPAPVHVRVLKSTEPNAFALANGSIYVTTELLTLLHDESELASVLGHELTHYTNEHTLRGLRDERHKEAAAHAAGLVLRAVLALVAANNKFSLPNGPSIPEVSLAIWARASIMGYSRDLEREADDGGIHRMVAAGYDATGALVALQRLAEQPTPAHPEAVPLYASHPRLLERIASYRGLIAGELAGAVGTGRDTNPAEYRAQTAQVRLDQVAILLRAGAEERAAAALDAEMASGDSARAEFLAGEIARSQVPQNDATAERALAAYTRCVALPDAPVAAYREAGLLHRSRGDPAAASREFQAYLERAPGAVDAPLVRIYLEELRTVAPAPGATP